MTDEEVLKRAENISAIRHAESAVATKQAELDAVIATRDHLKATLDGNETVATTVETTDATDNSVAGVRKRIAPK